jgi:LacI family transcriptional regulator
VVGKSTLYDVALKAGVSTGTVSHAFHHPELIKEDTKRKVLDAARELHYFPSGNARGLASGKTNAIGLFSFDMLISSPLWCMPEENGDDDVVRESEISTFPLYVDEIEHGFELECKERDQALFLQALPNGKYESFVDSVGRVDGVALVEGFKPDAATIKALCEQRPVVLLSEPKSATTPCRFKSITLPERMPWSII